MTSVACPFCGAEHTSGTFVCPTTNRRLQGLLPVGTKVDDKYRIDGIIGVGGMGVVYRADQLAIRRSVALKMLLPEYIVYPDLVARVQREARTAGQIESPNVVSIVDLGNTTEYGPYIAMELLRGQELATVVERAGGRMDPAEAVDIMRQVLTGLEAAHKRGVIHRDLKPENIFLTEDESGNRRVKVLDFGISKLRDDTELNSLTRTGTVMGTPQFMAPEQAAGARDQDVRLDLYASGAVLYAILCNGLPYEAENYNLLINEILNKQPIQLLQRNPGLDPRLASIVMKSIAKKPDNRYQSAREMADALGAWYDQRHTPFTPAAPPAMRIQAARAASFLGADTPAIDLRKNPSALGPGAREPGRYGNAAPSLLSTPDEHLSPDDPAYLDRAEATVVVPVPYHGADPDHDFYDENPPLPPRSPVPERPSGSRLSNSERPDEDRGSSIPSILLESPLDAPPIVLPSEPKGPPTDDVWARLRTDASPPQRDKLIDEVEEQNRRRVWIIFAVATLVVLALAIVGLGALFPQTFRHLTSPNDDRLPPPAAQTVNVADPPVTPPAAITSAALTAAAPIATDASAPAPTTASPVIVTDASVLAPTVTTDASVLTSPRDSGSTDASAANLDVLSNQRSRRGERRSRHRHSHRSAER